MPRFFVALLASALSVFAAQCTVDEEAKGSPYFLSLSARFSSGSITATATLPQQLFEDAVTVFIEVAGSNSPESPRLFLETSGDRVAIENGASLHFVPRAHERIVFSVSTETGEPLCAWQPTVRIVAKSHTGLVEGFQSILDSVNFFNRGDPIHLAIGGKLANPSARFRIEGEDATVLARTSWEVILRDPRPATGFRTIESLGYSITVPFVQIALQLTKMKLNVRVVGFDSVRRNHDYAPDLMLTNMNDRTMSVLCGKSLRLGHDDYEGRAIPLHRGGDGAFTATCKVKYHDEGRPVLIARILERSPTAVKHRLRAPRQPFFKKSVLE